MSGTTQVAINTDQNFPSVTLQPLEADGTTAAPLFGVPTWATSDATVISVTPAADGMSAVVSTVAAGGPARITVTAEADPTPGVNTITGVSDDIMVSLGPLSEAKTITITLGTPTAKAAPAGP